MFALPDPTPRILQALAVVLVAVTAFSYAFYPERADQDVWWHLKTGKVIVESGYHLPENDIFTYTAADVPWHNHEWLAQVFFYKLFEWGGGYARNLIGLRLAIAVKAAILAAGFLIVLWLVQQRCRSMFGSALIVLLAIDVSRGTLSLRPPVLTFFLFPVYLLVLSQWKARRRPNAMLLVLPPLMALWANLHGGFLVGLIAIFFYFAGEALERLLWHRGLPPELVESPSPDFRRRMIWLGAIGLACFAASLATPYGLRLYLLPSRVLGAKELVKTIAEMRSPLSPDVAPFFLTFDAMVVLAVLSLAVARLVSARRPAAADLLLLAFFGYQALRHQRHLPLFALAAAPVIGWAAGQSLDAGGLAFRRHLGWIAGAAALLLASYWLGLRGDPYFARNAQLAGGVTYLEENYPKAACDFILVNDFHGRLVNPINCAGYLIWRLSPMPHKLFTDPRFDIFGDRFVWQAMVVRYGLVRDEDTTVAARSDLEWRKLNIRPDEGRAIATTLARQYAYDTFDWRKVGLTAKEGATVRRRLESASWAEILDKWDVQWVIAESGSPGRWRMLFSGQWELVFSPDWDVIFPGLRLYPSSLGYDIFIRKTEANKELIERAKASFRHLVLGGL